MVCKYTFFSRIMLIYQHYANNEFKSYMKRLFSAVLFFMSAASFAASPATTQQKAKLPPAPANDIVIVTRPAIYGLWAMALPNTTCKEFYNFKENNAVVVNSAAEWSTGMYEYQPSVEDNKIGALAIQMKFDNNQKDCSGEAIQQSGELSQYYVRWQDPNNIQFCSSADPKQCPVALKRLLP